MCRTSHNIAVCQQKERETDENELGFRLRAQDPPAHIYLPLYSEIVERQEQRSRFNRKNAISTLVALQKPFSFAERDEKKLKEKVSFLSIFCLPFLGMKELVQDLERFGRLVEICKTKF